MHIKKQQLELDMVLTGSKLGKEYIKAVFCHPAYLTYMQISSSWENPGWLNHKLESRLPEEISTTQICRWYHPNGRKQRGTKEPFDEDQRGEWKGWLKTQYSTDEDHDIRFYHFMVIIWGKSGNSGRLYFGGLQNHCRWWLQPWN